ncbi:MAG: EAL domain-containing protein, partial [Burkholderiaceae bacterium]|nr:EAL domain-containing protein [Burkholderiaceae bacterium]
MDNPNRPKAIPVTWHASRPGAEPASALQARPPNSVSETPLAALIDVESLRTLLDDFSALIGIATALLDLEGNILQSAGWQSACTGYHRANPRSCANCTESDLFLASHLQEGEFVDYKCKNGLWDVVTPVFVGRQHLGNLYCGQFFYDDDDVDEGYFAAQAERFGYPSGAYLEAIRAIPRFSRLHVRRVMAHIVGIASHLSRLSLTNLKLSESRSQMETLINTLPDPVWLKDTDGVFLACNRAFEHMLGAPAAGIVGKTDHDFFPAEQADFFRQKDRESISTSGPKVNEEWLTSAETGQPVLLETIKTALPGANGQPTGVLGIARDITQRKRAEDYLHLMSKVFSDSGEAILITDANNLILTVNDKFTELTGYAPAEAIGKNPGMLSAGDTPREVYAQMWAELARHDFWQGELWDRRKNGEPYPKRLSISVVKDGDGRIINYIGSFEDITQRKAAEDNIRHLAYHDTLTDLPNRFSLHERMTQSIAFAQRFEQSLAVMLIDLDRFKAINDTLGHNVGDQLLIQVAKRLSGAVRESDIVARLGGDEFVVVLSGIDARADVVALAAALVNSIAAPYSIAGHELRTSPSVGICLYPQDATEIGDLIKNADIAMYHAKAAGRGHYQFYTEKMQADVTQRVMVENELDQALAQGQFVLHYQPQIDLGTGRVAGVEALVRWQHPSRGMIYPGDFIALAEESGLIVPLGKWVLEQACQQLKRWRAAGLLDLYIAVNLSALQFQDQTLPELVRHALEQSGLPPHRLHLEITESMAMRNPEDNIVMLKALSRIGVKLALDDFGTGYSSLAYLKLFPIDVIKIDRSFVKDIETDENDAAICEMTMLLAQKLGMRVVAEGVETPAQLAFLTDIGCESIQGYLFSKPLPADQIPQYIAGFGLAGADQAAPPLRRSSPLAAARA